MSAAVDLPFDQDDRDAVRTRHNVGVFVEAGAGTGKTHTIVRRIVSMVADGALELRDLAAITFTEAAAAELRDRIRDSLEQAAAGNDPDVTEPIPQECCRVALAQVDEAALTTIHGFAQRLLAEHPLEAGLPPGFEVLDPIRARVELEQRWAEFVDDLYAQPDFEETLLRGLMLGIGAAQLHGIALLLHENHDRLPELDEPPALPPLDAAPVLAALDQLIAHRPSCIADADNLAQRIDATAPPLRARLEGVASELDLIDVLTDAQRNPLKCRQGRKDSWRGSIDDVRDATEAVDAAITTLLGDQRRAVLARLTAPVVAFVQRAAAERRAAGTLEFHDLLVLARDVLRADSSVRAALGARYRCVMLDEFQDTDPLQIEIAALVTAADPSQPASEWRNRPLRSGALVLVGDPKQSIYRFRRADMAVFHDAQRTLGLEHRGLTESFRSVPGILDFVNSVFGGLLVEADGVQARHVDLHPHRSPVGHDVPVAIFGDSAPENIGEIRDIEAGAVATLARRIKEEQWLVVDPETGEERAARYRDIALLIPSRTVLPAIEDALERADVPVRIESQSLVFSTSDVRDLVAVLAAIDDPTDEIAIVAALRSPAFGCSDADLVEHVGLGGRWDYRRDAPSDLPEGHRVSAGLQALRTYWEDRWWRTVSETLEAVVRERHVLELALDRRRPRDHWRRVRYLVDQARAWDDAGDASLRDFVAWVQEQADERARVSESVAPEPDHDAIRVLTIHGSKGLEFPIVVLAGLNGQPAYTDRPVIWGPAGAELQAGTKAAMTRVQTSGYEAAEQLEKEHDRAERVRLLYVAMTRARDHLVLSLHRKGTVDCHARAIAEHLPETGWVQLDLEPERPPRRRPASTIEPPASANADARQAWIDARAASLARASRRASVSATALAKPDGEREYATASVIDKAEQPTDDRPPWRRGRAGSAVGRAVHAVLQTIDLATGAGVDATARAQALAEEIPEREDEVRALVTSVLSAPIVRAAVANGSRYWREVPVGTSIDGLLVEGFVDLLVETPDGFVVVDYKTDRAPADEDLDAALARYTPQGAAYALVLESVLRQPVVGCVFVFARESGDAVEREVIDLPAAVAAVRAQVQTLVRSPD